MLFQNLDFIFLQLWTWCISNCFWCTRKNENYKLGSLDIIKKKYRKNNLNIFLKFTHL